MSDIYTDFLNKEKCIEEIKKHISVFNLPNTQFEQYNEILYLWAVGYPQDKIVFKQLNNEQNIKNVLISSSSNTNSAIRRILDQIVFDCDKKFGGSSSLIQTLMLNLTNTFTKTQTYYSSNLLIDWNRVFFEEILPISLAPYSKPNNLESFIEAAEKLIDTYPKEVIEPCLKAILEAGNNGSILVRPNPYSRSFAVRKEKNGYHFKTFKKSKIFEGLSRYANDKGITFTNPKILLVNGAVEEYYEIDDLLDECALTKQPLVILANRISDEVFTLIRENLERDILQCFAAEIKNDYNAVNTITDVAVVAASKVITPLTITSEYLMAEWSELNHVEEITFFKDGVVSIKNDATRNSVLQHVKTIMEKRREVDEETFEVLEPMYTARIQNLTSSPTYLYIPFDTEINGNTKEIQVDSIIRYLKSVMDYGVIEPKNLNINEILNDFEQKLELKNENKQHFENAKWIYKGVLENINNSFIPYIHIVGAIRLALNQLAMLYSSSGIIRKIS